MSFVRIGALSKRFGAVAALEDVTLDIPPASLTAVVGPSGSGKTTLLRLLAGFEAPDRGTIHLDGVTLAEANRILPAHLRPVGLVAQDGALFPHLSIADNIGFGLSRRDPNRAQTVASLIDLVELDRAMLARRPHELSGGQQQRVALARALARRPRLMLLDEPFSALDTGLRAAMREAVAAVLQRAGVAALLVTHDQGEALSFASQVAVLRAGRLAQFGPPRELYFRPADPQTAAFLGEAIVLLAELGDRVAHCALGTVATQTAARRGRGEILLRPEQIRLIHGGEGALATVTALRFGGDASAVVLQLAGAEPVTIRLRQPAFAPLQVGETVRLSVEGTAHVF